MIEYIVETRKIYGIDTPHSIAELFEYEQELEDCCIITTNKHYGMYHLTRLKEEIEELEYDLTQEELDFCEEVYKFCENLFENSTLDEHIEVRFIDRGYNL